MCLNIYDSLLILGIHFQEISIISTNLYPLWTQDSLLKENMSSLNLNTFTSFSIRDTLDFSPCSFKVNVFKHLVI